MQSRPGQGQGQRRTSPECPADVLPWQERRAHRRPPPARPAENVPALRSPAQSPSQCSPAQAPRWPLSGWEDTCLPSAGAHGRGRSFLPKPHAPHLPPHSSGSDLSLFSLPSSLLADPAAVFDQFFGCWCFWKNPYPTWLLNMEPRTCCAAKMEGSEFSRWF